MRKTELIKMLRSGNSIKEMALIVNKSQSTVSYWLAKYGLKGVCLPGKRVRDINGRLMSNRPEYLCRFCGETDKEKMMKKGGDRRHYTVCVKCHGAYTIERCREKKKKAIQYKGGKCMKCGYNKCDDALEFHHRDPSKKDVNFVSIKKRKYEDMIRELDKCDLLCSNCHKEEHYSIGEL